MLARVQYCVHIVCPHQYVMYLLTREPSKSETVKIKRINENDVARYCMCVFRCSMFVVCTHILFDNNMTLISSRAQSSSTDEWANLNRRIVTRPIRGYYYENSEFPHIFCSRTNFVEKLKTTHSIESAFTMAHPHVVMLKNSLFIAWQCRSICIYTKRKW